MATESMRAKSTAYVDGFSRCYPEDIVNAIPDAQACAWMLDNVPLLDCPDSAIEEIYYFRWWVYRKHIKQTPDGYVVTEFLPEVGWAGPHNTINCPIGHQLYEGRWIRDPTYLDDYCRFMLRGGKLHAYSCWFADGVYNRCCADGHAAFAISLLEGLLEYYRRWESTERDGLFYFTPWMDGMEFSISGNTEERARPTLNAYMYADALAISKIAAMAGEDATAEDHRARAAAIRSAVQEQLWNPELEFFASKDVDGHFMPRGQAVREAVGYIPWYFQLPDRGYESAWRYLNDPRCFLSPVGLTGADQSHPMYLAVNPGRLATWDGPIWPFATAQTLTAMQNLIRNYDQPFITAVDFVRELSKYAASHVRDGKPSICEVVPNPNEAQMGGSEHYNHSTFCDLVVTGLAGVVPRCDSTLLIDPLFPADWEYFRLSDISYHGHALTISWDRTGERYGEQGFCVDVDGTRRHSGDVPCRLSINLAEQDGQSGG